MSDKCYYNNDECGGALWFCRTCKEWFCESHNHTTEKGVNVECVSCERNRLEKEPKMVSFDFSIDTMVCVTAPEDTDPESLRGQAMAALVEKIGMGDIDFIFAHTTETN